MDGGQRQALSNAISLLPNCVTFYNKNSHFLRKSRIYPDVKIRKVETQLNTNKLTTVRG